MKIVERDNGAKRLLTQLAKTKATAVDVGVIGAKAGQEHDGGATNADVATFHEFGLGVPERSFIRGYVDEAKAKIQGLARRAVIAVGKGLDVDQALDVLGLAHVAGIQERIADGIDPPLAPETIERKGSSMPLVDTGQLRSSITFRRVSR